MTTTPLRVGRPRQAWLRSPRHVSLRARVGVLTALAAAGAVVLVSVVAFFIVRQNILATLDANLLQRANSAAQSELVDPQELATLPPGALGAGDITSVGPRVLALLEKS